MQRVVGPTAAGSSPHSLAANNLSSSVALEAVPDGGADTAARVGAAEVGGATRAKGAGDAGAVEAQQLVAVGGAAGILSRAVKGSVLHGVAAVLEALDRRLCVLDLEYPFDPANGTVLLQPARLEYYLHDVSAGIFQS